MFGKGIKKQLIFTNSELIEELIVRRITGNVEPFSCASCCWYHPYFYFGQSGSTQTLDMSRYPAVMYILKYVTDNTTFN